MSGFFDADNSRMTGGAFVVFGTTNGLPADIQNMSSSEGFAIKGKLATNISYTGASVSGAGDVNGDGYADVVVGARNGGDTVATGETFVIFGKASGFATVNLGSLSASDGFTISGEASQDQAGYSVSDAGDVNGDGYADIIVGANHNDAGGQDAGAAYVVFGKASGFADIDLATMAAAATANGFKIQGAVAGEDAGSSVSSAGDINGDGFDDVIVGANINSTEATRAGRAYVVYGKATGLGNVDLANLADDQGFVIKGGATYNGHLGISVSEAGDLNGDRLDDMVVSSAGTNNARGASYIIYGQRPDTQVTRIGTAADQKIFGGAFNDTLKGMAGNDLLDGGGGNDTLTGGTGGDTMYGGAGNDTFFVDSSADKVIEAKNQGADTVFLTATFNLGAQQYVEELVLQGKAALKVTGSDSVNTITGNAGNNALNGLGGNDVILGAVGNDTLDGGVGNDTLTGGGGSDTMYGRAGDDVFYVDSIKDVVIEADKQGTDTVFSTASFNLGKQFVEMLVLQGSAALNATGSDSANTIVGNSAINVLNGLGSNDTMSGGDGGDGGDKLTGGMGADKLTGDAGADQFIYKMLADSTKANSGMDLITDFSHRQLDMIVLTTLDANSTKVGNQAFAFIGAADFTGQAGEVRFEKGVADTYVYADVNGDKRVDFAIHFDDSLKFVEKDFAL